MSKKDGSGSQSTLLARINNVEHTREFLQQPTKMAKSATTSKTKQTARQSRGRNTEASEVVPYRKKRRTDNIETSQADDCATIMVSDDNNSRQEEPLTTQEMFRVMTVKISKVDQKVIDEKAHNQKIFQKLIDEIAKVNQNMETVNQKMETYGEKLAEVSRNQVPNQVAAALGTTKRSSISTITEPAMTKEQKKQILGSLRKFYRVKAFCHAKFIDDERGIRAWKQAEKDKIVHEFTEKDLPTHQRIELVATTFCALRNATQSACRTSFFSKFITCRNCIGLVHLTVSHHNLIRV